MPTNKELQTKLTEANARIAELEQKLELAQTVIDDEVHHEPNDKLFELVKAQMCCTPLTGFDTNHKLKVMVKNAQAALEVIENE